LQPRDAVGKALSEKAVHTSDDEEESKQDWHYTLPVTQAI
jgi:hypothetical protein